LANATNTLNWDTVFAIPIPYVNSAIVSKKSSPAGFNYSSPKGDTVKGTFSDWQIAPGGDGALIWMTIPVSLVSGSCELGGFAWEQGKLIVEVRLEYLPHENIENLFNLKVKSKSVDPANPVVSLKTAIFTKPVTGKAVDNFGASVVQSVVTTLIIDWLNEHLIDFDHVFAMVNINEKIDKDAQWAWCKPSYTDYAYCDAQSPDKSILGVLCMTGGRKAGLAQLQQIDPYVIPNGGKAGFLVSPARFLHDLMLPTLPFKWKYSTVNDYEIKSDADTQTGKYQHVLKLKDGENIRLDDVEHAGSVFTPYMTKMSITNEDEQLIFSTYTETDVGEGVTAWCQTTHWYTIEVGSNKNGQTLKYREVKTAVVEHGTHTSLGTEILKWMIIVAGVIATVVLCFVTEGAALVVGGVIIGVLVGVAVASPDIIAAVDNNTAPNLDLLTLNTTDPIKWSAQNVFSLTSVQLNNALQLGGDPDFS